MAYIFDNNKLYQGFYSLDLSKNRGGTGRGIYGSFEDVLTELYGKPEIDEIIPLTSQRLIDAAGANTAIELGYVAYRTVWETDTTRIEMILGTYDYVMGIYISYTDINYQTNPEKSGL